jgi:hypothetical protein
LDCGGEIYQFRQARCRFRRGHFDVEADGRKCLLHFYGLRFLSVSSAAELVGRIFTRKSVSDRVVAEVYFNFADKWVCLHPLKITWRAYEPTRQLITVVFRANVTDAENGEITPVEGSIRCKIMTRLE